MERMMELWQFYAMMAAIYIQSLLSEKARAITGAAFCTLSAVYAGLELVKTIKG